MNQLSLHLNTSNYLFSAVESGNIEKVRKLIRVTSDSCMCLNGYSLLCEATEKNFKDISKLLLMRGCKVNCDSCCKTPLHLAVKNQSLEIAELILNKGADINATNDENETALHIAVKNDDIAIVELLLKNGACGASFDRNYHGITPLHIAAERGCSQVVEILLKYNVDINSISLSLFKECYTPLHCAVENCNEERILLLLSKGANVNAKAKFGETALHLAVEKGYLHIVVHLLKAGAIVDDVYTSSFKKGYTALHLAILNKYEKIVKLLLDNGAYIDFEDEQGNTALYLAVVAGLDLIVDHILNHCPDINNKKNIKSLTTAVLSCNDKITYRNIIEKLVNYGYNICAEDLANNKFLHASVMKGCVKVVDMCLKLGVHINTLVDIENGLSLLHSAVIYKHEDLTKFLLENSADIDAVDINGVTPLYYAVQNSDEKIAKLLLCYGAKINNYNYFLNIAAKEGCKEIIEIVLENNNYFDINACDMMGRNALHFTCHLKQTPFTKSLNDESYRDYIIKKGEIARLLLSKGIDVNAKTKYGATVLHETIEKELVEIVGALLDYNADIESINSRGMTPLSLSVSTGNEIIIKMLLDKGANVNSKSYCGILPFHVATEKGFTKVLEILLRYNADINSKRNDGMTALHIAVMSGNQDVVKFLLDHGTYINSTDIVCQTPLHMAVKKNLRDIACILIYHGADINACNKNGCTPLLIAIHESNNSMVSVLLTFNCNIDVLIDKKFDIHIKMIIIHHLFKLRALGVFLDDKLVKFLEITTHSWADLLHSREHNEVQELKNKTTNNMISLFDFLMIENINRVELLTRCSNLEEIVESEHFMEKFPIYGTMVRYKFIMGKERSKLLNDCRISLLCTDVNNVRLPLLCIDVLLSYLSNNDLNALCGATRYSNYMSKFYGNTEKNYFYL